MGKSRNGRIKQRYQQTISSNAASQAKSVVDKMLQDRNYGLAFVWRNMQHTYNFCTRQFLLTVSGPTDKESYEKASKHLGILFSEKSPDNIADMLNQTGIQFDMSRGRYLPLSLFNYIIDPQTNFVRWVYQGGGDILTHLKNDPKTSVECAIAQQLIFLVALQQLPGGNDRINRYLETHPGEEISLATYNNREYSLFKKISEGNVPHPVFLNNHIPVFDYDAQKKLFQDPNNPIPIGSLCRFEGCAAWNFYIYHENMQRNPDPQAPHTATFKPMTMSALHGENSIYIGNDPSSNEPRFLIFLQTPNREKLLDLGYSKKFVDLLCRKVKGGQYQVKTFDEIIGSLGGAGKLALEDGVVDKNTLLSEQFCFSVRESGIMRYPQVRPKHNFKPIGITNISCPLIHLELLQDVDN